MATETDAARDRVIAARADLADELEAMEASVRAAVDIPAKIRRSPAKAAAVVGGVGFLALKGPQRALRRRQARRARPVRGHAQVDAARRDREDAAQARGRRRQGPRDARARLRGLRHGGREKERAGRKRGARHRRRRRRSSRVALRTAAERLLNPDEEGFAAKLDEVRERAEREAGGAREPRTAKTDGKDASAGSADDVHGRRRPDPLHSRTGEWRNGRRAGLRSRCRVSGVSVRPRPRLPGSLARRERAPGRDRGPALYFPGDARHHHPRPQVHRRARDRAAPRASRSRHQGRRPAPLATDPRPGLPAGQGAASRPRARPRARAPSSTTPSSTSSNRPTARPSSRRTSCR